MPGHFDHRPLAFAGALLALMLAAANLRGGLVVIGPLVEDIRAALQISAAAFGLLMTLPLICFGSVSLLVPWIAARMPPLHLVLGGLLLIALGAWLRLTLDYSQMLGGTLLLGTGIALLNVLIPGLVKGLFPHQSGTLTGLYSLILTLGASLSVFTAIPMRDGFADWQAPMLVWFLFPLLAGLAWLPMLRVRFEPKGQASLSTSVWKIPRAWSLALFMGLQSSMFYVLATWLPRLLMDGGHSDAEAGNLASIFMLISIPFSLIVPVWAARQPSQRVISVLITLAGLFGIAGLLWIPEQLPELWVALLGVYGGSSISLALALFALKSSDMRQATALSAMSQGLGYLLASVTPSLIGAIYDLQHSWTLALWLLAAMLIAQGISGHFICAPQKIDER